MNAITTLNAEDLSHLDDALVLRHVDLARQIAQLKAQLDATNVAIIERLPRLESSSKTHPLGSMKVTLSQTTSYKGDIKLIIPALQAAGVPESEWPLKQTLDGTAYKRSATLQSVLGKLVEVTTGSVSVKVSS